MCIKGSSPRTKLNSESSLGADDTSVVHWVIHLRKYLSRPRILAISSCDEQLIHVKDTLYEELWIESQVEEY